MAPESATMESSGRPMVSPDGESVLFSVMEGGQGHLYLHTLATGRTRIVPGTERALGATWSFDGRSFLARSGAEIARMDTSGSLAQPFPRWFDPDDASWGPRGIIDAGGQEVRWAAADGSDVRILKNHPKSALMYASWLPGGRWLIYNQVTAGGGTNVTYAVHALTMDGKIESPPGGRPLLQRSLSGSPR
jgi:Tol biopolymer transport system component